MSVFVAIGDTFTPPWYLNEESASTVALEAKTGMKHL